jgi:hypothetical protein
MANFFLEIAFDPYCSVRPKKGLRLCMRYSLAWFLYFPFGIFGGSLLLSHLISFAPYMYSLFFSRVPENINLRVVRIIVIPSGQFP